ncbi:MAG: hypothetical protein ACRD28_04620 [Acidobacteriaceae bacterium]
MSIPKALVRATVGRAVFALIACGLMLPVGLHAQTYSSSTVSYNLQNNYPPNPQYNSQYNNPPQYNQTPRYTGEGWGSHLVLEAGAGVTTPEGDTSNYANTGWNALLGAGIRFNHRLSLLAEWNFNRLGVPHSLAYAQAQVPDGNEHIWTLDLNPKFDVIHGSRTTLYVIGGGGFSRALTNFTYPVTVPCYFGYGYGYGFGYGYYGGCTGDVTVSHTSSNQGNWDAGLGGEWRVSPYSSGKIFLEARYTQLMTPNASLPPGYHAGLIPITLGFRW